MQQFTIHQAKTHLSRLVASAEAGEEIILARGDKPVARIVPILPEPKSRKLGWLAHQRPADGRSIIGPAFWEPLSDEEMGLADRDDDPLSPNYRG